MKGKAVALDIGTSGMRAQLLDLETGGVVRTRVTSRNPLPGSNVMDHLSFAIDRGTDVAGGILRSAVRELLAKLKAEDLRRLAVCGNPIQLSLFQGMEIRDLAYAGKNKLDEEGVKPVDRSGRVLAGDAVGLDPDVEVVVPPAVRHEIGADALAMMICSGFLDDDMCMVTDYGTNAEMAIKVGDRICTGSAAAGPALEGQQISCGMLAGPGALSDLERTPEGWRCKVLDESMDPVDGPLINLRSGFARRGGRAPAGITGTGTVALIYAGLQDERIELPEIRGGSIPVSRGISFSTEDLKEAGKAVGAIRAGQMTLMEKAGVSQRDIRTMYMAGASGTYVDPVKAKAVGMVPPMAERIVQVGNTSLRLACDLALHPDKLAELNEMRTKLLAEHVMFASSDVFRDLYVNELAYWTEGMPTDRYKRTLADLGLGGYLDGVSDSRIEKACARDIADIGESFEMFDLATSLRGEWDCSGCGACVRNCPEKALTKEGKTFTINTGRCLGTACARCRDNCPDKVFDWNRMTLEG
ncbi:MAG: methylamine methyltransferase corrinoid protein reductive activase [Methanomethylophilus sp.]|jgi:methylamine methyltransferase corrinoid activation protein